MEKKKKSKYIIRIVRKNNNGYFPGSILHKSPQHKTKSGRSGGGSVEITAFNLCTLARDKWMSEVTRILMRSGDWIGRNFDANIPYFYLQSK